MNDEKIKNINKERVALVLIIPIFVGLFIGFVLTRIGYASSSKSELPPDTEPSLRILESHDSGVVLELTVPEFIMEQLKINGETCHVPSIKGYGETGTAGQPRLPVKGVMIGIHEGVEPVVEVLEAQAESASQRYQICPQDKPAFKIDLNGEIEYLGVEVVPDEAVYQTDRFMPENLVEVVSVGWMRSQRVATLRLQPFQYNPVSGELRYFSRIVVRLTYSGSVDQPARSPGVFIDEGAFENILSHTLLNYEQAREWRSGSAVSSQRIASQLNQSGGSYKILVDQSGIYKVSYEDLMNAGVTVNELNELDPRTFRLFNQDTEVAIYVEGEIDGRFAPDEYLLFYGQKLNTKFSDVNVYWLSWGVMNGNRMPPVDGTPSEGGIFPKHYKTSMHLEEDHIYQSDRPSGLELDHWYWDYVQTPSILTQTFSAELSNISTEPVSAMLRGKFNSYSANPEHHVYVYLNDKPVKDFYFPNLGEYLLDEDITQTTYLTETTNIIKVEIPTDTGSPSQPSQAVLINWFEIDYYDTFVADNDLLWFDGEEGEEMGTWENKLNVSGFKSDDIWVFDLTEPVTPTLILSSTITASGGSYEIIFEHQITEEHHYLALTPSRWLSPTDIFIDSPSSLKATTNGADYIIITHKDFYTDVIPLGSFRQGQGYRTMVVDVQDVYDEFNDGVVDPSAIHNFLEYAYDNWARPAPLAVLLVGDGNYDPKDNMGKGEVSYIPPYLADVDYWLGETAADNRYVTISGEDILPDMYLGRLPVKTSTEAADIVAKILSYEQNPPLDGWNMDVMFVADDNDPSAGNFPVLSDDIADNFLPPSYTTDKIYYRVTHSTPADVTAAIIAGINQGRLMVSYIGHASPYWWGGEFFFDTLYYRNDIDSLTNTDRLSFFIPMTCLEGYFIRPGVPDGYDVSSVGEKVVRAPGKGAIASFSPTGLGVSTGHDFLEKGLFEAIFKNGANRVGLATTFAKYYLYANTGGYREMIDTYILFGDPLTKLHVDYHYYFPIVFK